EVFDRVVVMARGRIVADGKPTTVFRETAVLADANVEPPQLTRLGDALGWSETRTDVTGFVSRLAGTR
ncbi:MAG: hypothetical protein Q8M65_01695, partial [Rhodoglobus sp.]|nr:hypothetical protein [Rhodoglobus sp.]